MKPIHDHGYWCGKDVLEQHAFDPYLGRELVHFFLEEKAKSVADFGCGLADYVKMLRVYHIDCQGFDGNPDTPSLTDGVAEVLDLSQPFRLNKSFDWVLSLEVGEHIPPLYESTFIENLERHAKVGILLSWGIEGQGGFGHVNLRNNDYIKKLFRDKGYRDDLLVEQRLREHASLSWFKKTLMVFRKI